MSQLLLLAQQKIKQNVVLIASYSENLLKYKDIKIKKHKQDYPDFGVTYLCEYQYENANLEKWSQDGITGPKEADKWEFNEGYFDLKGSFPVELANLFNFTENICNE